MKIKNNKWLIRGFCALAAVVLWVLVMMKVNPVWESEFKDIKVTVNNLSVLENDKYVLMDDKNNFKVNVKVSGLKNNLLKVDAKDIVASIDLNDITGSNKEGTHQVAVNIQSLNNVEVVSYSPMYITCNIEKVVTKSIGVKVKYEGEQAQGYYIGNGVSNPNSVIIKGPSSVVESAEEAIAVVDVQGQNSTLNRTEPLRITDKNGSEILTLDISPLTVDVHLPIYPTKKVPVVPTYVGKTKDGYKMTDITSDTETVVIAGPSSILNSISFIKTEPIDINDANVNVSSEKYLVVDDKLIVTDGLEKVKVTANIESITEKQYDFTYEDIDILNLENGYIASFVYDENVDNKDIQNENVANSTTDTNNTANKKKLSIKLQDALSVINMIEQSNINLSIDLKNLGEGTYNVPLNVKIEGDSEIDVDKITKSIENIKIKITKKTSELQE